MYNIIFRLSRWLSGKESACNAGTTGSIPESGRSPGKGNSNLLYYSCLENPMDRESLVGLNSPQNRKQSDTIERQPQHHIQVYNMIKYLCVLENDPHKKYS